MTTVEAQVNGVRVFYEEYEEGKKAALAYARGSFPYLFRERVSAALQRAADRGLTGELRIMVDGMPRYEHPYRDPRDGALRWLSGTESSAALRRVTRGLRGSNGTQVEIGGGNGRRTFDHELAARLYAVLPDYAAVGRALQVSGDAVRQAVRRNVEGLDS
jgi:hypothetical protein